MVAVVTGGAGFIGSHVVESLLADGVKTHVIDDLSTGDLKRVPGEAEMHQADISTPDVESLIERINPDQIYHLGAQSSVTVSVKNPERDCSVNVLGTMRIAQVAKEVEAPIVFTSTGGALYGDAAPLPTPETHPPAPLSPYGASKWAGEAYIRTWALASKIPHSVCRLGNVYGPRQSPYGEAGVVSIFSRKLWLGESPLVFGSGAPTRDYIHVSDVVGAMRAASGAGGVFNVSTGVETSTMRVFELVNEISGAGVAPTLAPLREGELIRSCLDPSRAAEQLGWEAQIGLAEGISATYEALIREFKSE